METHAALRMHHAAAFAFALTCVRGDRPLAEDVCQESYTRVLSRRAVFGQKSSFKTWLFGVVRRVAYELLRAEQRRRLSPGSIPVAEAAQSASLDERMIASREASRVRTALQSLSPQQASVLHLVFYEEMTLEEAASVMSVTLGTARTHYHRGKVAMRAALGPRIENKE